MRPPLRAQHGQLVAAAGLSGFDCDLSQNEIRFDPCLPVSTEADVFRTLWSCGRGWGTYIQRRDPASGLWQPSLEVLGGNLSGVRVTACGQTWTL